MIRPVSRDEIVMLQLSGREVYQLLDCIGHARQNLKKAPSELSEGMLRELNELTKKIAAHLKDCVKIDAEGGK
jgi:hypothetical protein